MSGRDEDRRRLERAVAASPGDAAARLALARDLARAGRRDEAADHVEKVLEDDPLSEAGVRAVDDVGLGPLARGSPWPTVHGQNDRARRAAGPGARRGKLVQRLRVGAPKGKLGNGDVEAALSITVGSRGTIYLATNHRRLVALDVASGQPRWIRAFEHPFAAPTVGAGERLVVQMLDSVRLLDARTGETCWIARAPGVSSDPVPANATFAPRGLVLCPGLRGALYALDAVTGRLRWSVATRAQYAAPVVDGDRIFVAGFGELASFDLDGRELSRLRVPIKGAPLALMPVLAREHVFLARRYGEEGPVFVARRGERGLEGRLAPVVGPDLALGGSLDGRSLLDFQHGHFVHGAEVEDRSLSPPFHRQPPPTPWIAADSGGCFYALGFGPQLFWLDGSLGVVKKMLDEVHPGPVVVGPGSTTLVASIELGIVQVVE